MTEGQVIELYTSNNLNVLTTVIGGTTGQLGWWIECQVTPDTILTIHKGKDGSEYRQMSGGLFYADQFVDGLADHLLAMFMLICEDCLWK